LAFSLGLIIIAFYVLRVYRRRLLPPIERRDRGEALTQLHILQAEMRKKLEENAVSENTSTVDEPVASPPDPPPRREPEDEEARKEALAQLQALQAKMRKRLEEDQAREAASGVDTRPPDSGIDPTDSEL
jgi:hypothetical protein